MYGSKSKGAMQPLFAAALAAHTPPDIELKLYDDRIEDIPYDEPTDLVALTIETFCARRAYKIAGEYRKRNVKVIAGGYHPTLLPKECLEYVDCILTGDAEILWPAIINDLKHNRLKKHYSQKENIAGTAIKFQRDIFKDKSYGPIEMVQWGRGCPHNCEFCSIKSFYKSGQICRPIDDVVEELSSLKKKTVFFIDDNLMHTRKEFVQFLKEITPLKIKWICQISITIAQDEELLKLMAESGCFVVLIGIESFNPANLKLMNKQWNTSNLDYNEAIQKIKSYGMLIYGTFIFGYDHDTTDSFKYAIDFAMKHSFFIANFNPLYPLPGTGLYKRYQNESRLIDKWWLENDFYYGKSMFTPKGMSSRDLELGCYKSKLEFNSWKSILQRGAGQFKTNHRLVNLALFFYVNSINRSEIIHKQGKLLGV